MKKFVFMMAICSSVVVCMGCAPAVTTNSGPSVPAPGTLDTSFGNGGIVITDYVYEASGQSYSAYNEINAIALQSDGKIVVAGYADISGDRGEDLYPLP